MVRTIRDKFHYECDQTGCETTESNDREDLLPLGWQHYKVCRGELKCQSAEEFYFCPDHNKEVYRPG